MHVLIPALHRPIKPTGVCRHAANLAQCLADISSITQVTLIVGEWQKKYFEQSFELLSSKINIISVAITNSSLSRNRWFMFGLPKLADRLSPNIVHMSFPFPFVRQWFKSPIVSTIHDLYPYEYPENFGYPQVWFNRLFLQQCVCNSDGLTCVSKQTLEALERFFPFAKSAKKTEVIYNFVDFVNTDLKRPRRLAVEGDLRFILSVGQHRKNKNLDVLIQAYALLRKDETTEPETKLLIVGSSGPETDRLTDLVQVLNLEKQVIFLSSLEDSELCWLYKNCELFTIPSSTEGFCLPLVEALSMSCRVVCSDIPIFREVGALNCRYFQLSSNLAEELAKAIAAEISDSRHKPGSPDSRFSKESVAQHLLKFYASIE